ncbi:MAG: Nif11-like leader peptide family RiPP precursor [Desulfobacterales bacterium]|nr:Nif11-like leader peptide family RiPP precursor [Desulfobacterales bacterium]MBF0396002.1 Nif11-like leader peptide family RiPP precursor [Desulfobacterales bacterium]
MNSQEIEKFVKMTNEDQNLREMLKKAITSLATQTEQVKMPDNGSGFVKQENVQKVLQEVVNIANEKGFDFKADDLSAFFQQKIESMKSSKELSMEELEQIAGGSAVGAFALSAVTLGFSCLFVSIYGAASGDNCAVTLDANVGW